MLRLAMNIVIWYFSSFIFWNKGKLSRTIGIIYGEKCMKTIQCLLVMTKVHKPVIIYL